jgi:hypothetical protein
MYDLTDRASQQFTTSTVSIQLKMGSIETNMKVLIIGAGMIPFSHYENPALNLQVRLVVL